MNRLAAFERRSNSTTIGRFAISIAAGLSMVLFAAAAEARSVQLVAAGGGKVRALVVGIDNYKSRSIPTLKGAVKDAQDIETTLKSAGVSELTVLIDPTANWKNFEAAMNRLVDVSGAGDLVIITFAGHGSQAPELVKGSESDGLDEIMLLSGFDSVGADAIRERVVDDEMNHWLAQLAKKKVDVLYVADTCHGGGMLRSPDFRSGALSYRFAKISMEPQSNKVAAISNAADARLSVDDLPNVTFLGAVNKFSKAPEVSIPGIPTLRGALSYAVARSISDGKDGAVTRQQLFQYARQVTYQYSQTNQTIATEPTGSGAKLDKIVFRLKVSGEPAAQAPAPANDMIRLRIAGGDPNALSGVTPGQFPFRIVKNGEDADMVWDAAKGDVLNGYGDVIVAGSVTAPDIPFIADAVGATLAVARLSETGPVSMRLLPNDARFHNGDRVRFHIEDIAGKYLILVNLSGTGQVQFLYPRSDKKDAAQISTVDYDLLLDVGKPFGSDRLIAIVSERRLEQAEAAISALRDQMAAGELINIMRSVHLSDRSVRFGMAASFTAP